MEYNSENILIADSLEEVASAELEQIHDNLTTAIEIFAGVLPQDVEVERMIACEQYRELFYLRTNVFYQLAKREQERRIAK